MQARPSDRMGGYRLMATWPKGTVDDWKEVVDQCRGMDEFDMSLAPEVQTDKRLIKVLPCQFCKRPLVVTTFYVLAWAKCGTCTGEDRGPRPTGSQTVVQRGRTDPALAVDLASVLVNQPFETVSCPLNPAHRMELKSVSWSPHYGPGHYHPKDGTWIQDAQGETVTHQCLECFTVVSYTTTIRTQLRRQNEPKVKPDTGEPTRHYLHGTYEDPPPPGIQEEEEEAA